MGNKHKATMHTNNHLSDYIYSMATLYCTVCLMSIKPGQFMKLYKLCKIIQDNLFIYSLQATGAFLEHSQTFMVGLFCEKFNS